MVEAWVAIDADKTGRVEEREIIEVPPTGSRARTFSREAGTLDWPQALPNERSKPFPGRISATPS